MTGAGLLTLGLSPIALTQTLSLCFIACKTVQATSLVVSDAASLQLLKASLPLVVLATLSVLAGMRLQSRISVETYRALLRKVPGAMAIMLVTQATWELSRA